MHEPVFMDAVRAALVNRYDIEEQIGSGRNAVVFRARDLKFERAVAVKVLRPDLTRSLARVRFLREITIAARLQHPGIVPLYDSGEAGDFVYFVMPLVEGATLRARLSAESPLPVAEAVRITLDIAKALDYAHEHGIVHRDIKPENILIHDGRAIIADFGFAWAVDAAAGERLTESGVTLGTPAYMPPEQATGGTVDRRSDVYSMACVAYEMLAGEPPFSGTSPRMLLARHLVDRATPITSLRPEIAPHIDLAIGRALAKVPADRFATAGQLASALQAPAEGSAQGRRRRLATGLTIAAALALLAIGLRFWSPDRAGPIAGEPQRIVLLPFEHLGVADDRHITAGITEEIRSRLARSPALHVISATSAAGYAPGEWSYVEVERELGVDFILSGSVRIQRMAGGAGTIRVVTHLTRTSDGRELWTAPFEGSIEPGSMFGVQFEIAEGVARELDIKLKSGPEDPGQFAPTRNVAAFDSYLRGNASAMFYTAEATRSAIEMYGRAVQLDPGFALAQAKLALALTLYYAVFDRSEEHLAEARAAARAAMTIAPQLQEVRLAQAYTTLWAAGDYGPALHAFKELVDEQPDNSQLLWSVAQLERRLGRLDDALETSRRALELDPRSPEHALDLGHTLLLMRRYVEAREYMERAIGLAPDWLPPYASLAFVIRLETGDVEQSQRALRRAFAYVEPIDALRLWIGRYPWELAFLDSALLQVFDTLSIESAGVDTARYHLTRGDVARWAGRELDADSAYLRAVRYLERRSSSEDQTPQIHADLAVALAGTGRSAEAVQHAKRALDQVPPERDAYQSTVLMLTLAQVYVMVDDHEAAFDWLERVLGQPAAFSRALLSIHPNFEPLRSDDRFRELVDDPGD